MSYQATTFAILPSITIVKSASTIELRASPLKSLDTNGKSDTPRIPFNSPSAALRNAALMLSLVASFSSSTTKSVTDTFGVGTRRAKPFNLPFNSGNTKATAFAAPVVVGIIDIAAARARRKSLCGASNTRWSLV